MVAIDRDGRKCLAVGVKPQLDIVDQANESVAAPETNGLFLPGRGRQQAEEPRGVPPFLFSIGKVPAGRDVRWWRYWSRGDTMNG
jgi:hypothetical protein